MVYLLGIELFIESFQLSWEETNDIINIDGVQVTLIHSTTRNAVSCFFRIETVLPFAIYGTWYSMF